MAQTQGSLKFKFNNYNLSPVPHPANPKSFVYHTPHLGVKINTGDKKIVIDQKFI